MTMTTLQTDNPTLVKIAALLRQAESTNIEEEAKAFNEKAQRLASLHSINLAMAANFIPAHERKESPTHKSITWGGEYHRKRGNDQLVSLFTAIAGANDVRCNIYQDSSGVIAFGFPSDIEMVEMLFASLMIQMSEQVTAYLKKGEYKSELVYREKKVYNKSWGGYDIVPGRYQMDGREARRAFQAGFISEISSRLHAARRKAVQETEESRIMEAKAMGVEVNPFKDPEDPRYAPDCPAAAKWDEEHTMADSVALVLVRKDEEVNKYYSQTSRAKGSYKGSSAGPKYGTGAYGSGRSAGQNARLGAPKGLSGSRGSLRS